MSKFMVTVVVCIILGVIAFSVIIVAGIVHPTYTYQGVAEMSQAQYTEFMDKYGFENKGQQNFATAYNQQLDKLIVTYNFSSASNNLDKYGINEGGIDVARTFVIPIVLVGVLIGFIILIGSIEI